MLFLTTFGTRATGTLAIEELQGYVSHFLGLSRTSDGVQPSQSSILKKPNNTRQCKRPPSCLSFSKSTTISWPMLEWRDPCDVLRTHMSIPDLRFRSGPLLPRHWTIAHVTRNLIAVSATHCSVLCWKSAKWRSLCGFGPRHGVARSRGIPLASFTLQTPAKIQAERGFVLEFNVNSLRSEKHLIRSNVWATLREQFCLSDQSPLIDVSLWRNPLWILC